MKYFIKAILAGILIGIGGTVFLSCESKFIGASLFSIGLFMVCIWELNLYTGKIGYLIVNKPIFLIELLWTLIGNLIGTLFIGYILRLTRIADLIIPKAQKMAQMKLDDSLISILILSFFCGVLMYLAVNGFKVIKHDIGKYFSVYLGVVVFIMSGFEHCVANMYYFSISNMWSFQTIVYVIIMILGNSLGAFMFPIADKLLKKEK